MDISEIDISGTQRQMLAAIVDAYDDEEEPVKSSRVAELVDRSPGTVKNQMKKLTSIGIVDSVRGPTGGYRPNDNTYAVLGKETFDDEAAVNLARDYQRVDVTVANIDLTNVHHPTECWAHVQFQDAVPDLSPGDPIAIGPTPVSELVLAGEVIALIETDDEVLVDVATMEAPLSEP